MTHDAWTPDATARASVAALSSDTLFHAAEAIRTTAAVYKEVFVADA